MFLKSLELNGFKSFASRTTLNFHPGVTAVVGPNGCGKSNVLDSIRWVLGEQSAKALRGGEMADVIFNGTDSRKPIGMAEVSLTFADCEKELGVEWNEVRITRRVFRDGRSEYLLNKAPCRLRDIHALFMDTGIGRSAYSIMEQGRIDQILSSRPEDRRAIFEEAAGVTKYKAQRKEALRKLEYTEANLLRHTDIIKEVKRQIGSLQRQAGKARRYQSAMEDLRVLDTHWCSRQFGELATDKDRHQGEMEELNGRITQLEAELAAQEERMSGRRREMEATEEETQQARSKAQEIGARIVAAESRIEFNGERTGEFRSLTEQYQLDIAGAEEKLQVQESQIQEADQQLATLLNSLAEEERRLESHRQRLEEVKSRRASLETEAAEAARVTARAGNEAHQSRVLSESKNSDLESSSDRLRNLDKGLEEASGEVRRLEEQLNELQQRLTSSEAALQSTGDRLRSTEVALKEKEQELTEAESALAQSSKELASVESRLEVLHQLNEQGEGLNQGGQALLKGLDEPEFYRPAILGALASLIEVEERFIPAIEAALGQALHTVVLKDLDVALRALEQLAGKKMGRTALTATPLMPPTRDRQLEVLPQGSLAWALDKVSSVPETNALLTSLLDNTLITENLEQALQLHREMGGCRVVTLQGDVVHPHGIIEGGNGEDAANGASILQRKSQIRKLEEARGTMLDQVRDAEQKRDALSDERGRLSAETTELREMLQQRQVETGTIRGQIELVEKEFRQAKGQAESLTWERQELRQRRERMEEDLQQLHERLEELAREEQEAAAREQAARQSLEQLKTQETEDVERFNELRVRVATEKQREENLKRQRQPMTARLEELRQSIQRWQSDMTTYNERIERLEDESRTLQESLEDNRQSLQEAEKEVEAMQQKRANQLREFEELEAAMRKLRHQVSEMHASKNRHEVALTQIDLKTGNLQEYAAGRYQVNLEEFRNDTYLLLSTVKRLNDKRKSPVATEPESTAEQTVTDSSSPEEARGEERPADPAAEAGSPATEEAAPVRQEIDWDSVQMGIAELKEKIDNMGPVNLEAIQEFEELEERQAFLEEQFNDLTASKNELLDVISRLNSTTKTLFAETFEKIRDNFQEMFTELFGGGRANLLLVDDTDPLESGIEIIAKPPGKQLQAVSLLSGGERTMTAVALLFSIYMVKPSPFCVLDEMDAPLDESNINRFLRILDRFVNQSQFVVITHNKRTIARADILYGVTMEEHGVSKLVGVKFSRKGEPEVAGKTLDESPAGATQVETPSQSAVTT